MTGRIIIALPAALALGSFCLWGMKHHLHQRSIWGMLLQADMSSDPRQALSVLEKCWASLECRPASILKLHVAAALGSAHYQRGDYETAGQFLCKAGQLASDVGDEKKLVTITGCLGLCHYELGCYDESIQCHQQQLDGARQWKMKEEEIKATYGLDRAMKSLEQGIPEHQSQHNFESQFTPLLSDPRSPLSPYSSKNWMEPSLPDINGIVKTKMRNARRRFSSFMSVLLQTS